MNTAWFWEIGPDSRYRHVSNHFEHFMGIPLSEAIGRSIGDLWLVHENNYRSVKNLQQQIAVRSPLESIDFQCNNQYRTDQVFRIIGEPIFDETEMWRGYRGIAIDITGQVRVTHHPNVEQERPSGAFRDAEERCLLLAEIGADWLWETDEKLRFTHISGSSASAADLFVDKPLYHAREGFCPDQRDNESALCQQHLDTLRARRPFRDLELCYRSPNNSQCIVALSGRPMFDEAGVFRGYRGAGRDITAQKQTEAALREAKLAAERADNLKTRFLMAASHDLHQPLQTLSTVQTLLTRMIDDQKIRRHVDALGETVETMRTMLNVLLEVSRPQVGVLTPQDCDFPVGNLLAQMLSDFQYSAAENGLEFHVVPRRAILRSDPNLLREIIRNLVANAIKYTERGKVLLGCRRRGEALRVEVWDTGIGIADGQREHIFEEFYRSADAAHDRCQGLGLGLAIAQHLAHLLGLALDFRSTPGKGSMFAVTVPLGTSPPEVTQDNGLIPVSDTAASAVSILYVEDNVVVLDAVRYLLTVEGFRVTSATSGEHVTNLLGKRDFRADIVVSDYLLPAGVNGPDIINMVREKLGASIPAIIMTADGSGQTTQLARRLGCEILRKPVNGEQLVYAIHRLLGESSSA